MPAVKQFDPEQALDAMMQAFWREGYSRTSMADLVAASGVNRASLYATFGGKKAIFAKALRRYDALHRDAWLSRLAARHGAPAAISAAFEQVMSPEGAARGCLLVNTALEISPHDDDIRELVENSFESLRRFFGEMLRLAGRDEVDKRTALLLGLFLGLRVLGRGAPNTPVSRHIRAQVQQLID